MTKYASYNPTIPAPSPVIGWYDTEITAMLPATSSTLALVNVTSSWPANAARNNGWAISGGTLVSHTPPQSSTLAQAAAMALGQGLTITITGSLTLSATTFPIDPTAQLKINSNVNKLNQPGNTFFNDATTGRMLDMMNPPGWHVFTATQYLAVAEAIGAYVTVLMEIIDGNPDNLLVLPASNVTIAL